MMAGTSVILNMYLLTIGSMILGFSVYVGLETLERTTRKYVNWTGEGMLWLCRLMNWTGILSKSMLSRNPGRILHLSDSNKN